MKIGRKARDHGAKKICISSIMVRRGYRYRNIVKKVNDLLYMVCIAEDFIYMDQADITMAHVSSSDGVHLNANGTAILLFNMITYIDPLQCKLVCYDYEKSPSHSFFIVIHDVVYD